MAYPRGLRKSQRTLVNWITQFLNQFKIYNEKLGERDGLGLQTQDRVQTGWKPRYSLILSYLLFMCPVALSVTSDFPVDGEDIKTKIGIWARESKIQKFLVSKSSVVVLERHRQLWPQL